MTAAGLRFAEGDDSTVVREALMLLDETVYDQQNRPLHLSRQWIRGDRYIFRI